MTDNFGGKISWQVKKEKDSKQIMTTKINLKKKKFFNAIIWED